MRKAYIPNFRTHVPFLHEENLFVVGGWVGGWLWWMLKVDFGVKPNSASPLLYFECWFQMQKVCQIVQSDSLCPH